MTVAELIEHLQNFNQKAHVVFALHSDYAAMEMSDVYQMTAAENKLLVDQDNEKWPGQSGIVCGAVCYRQGRYCQAYPLWLYEEGEVPEYRDVVIFPGN